MSRFVVHSRRTLVVAVSALAMLATAFVAPAAAHGSTIDPMSRNYGCWKRWGSDFQNPAMATQDPMCYQAWQADPNAMWNWNGLYREGVAGNHQGAIPDGQLCSGGRTGGTRYAAMDTIGNWTATNIASSSNFTVVSHDQARHGGDYYRVYVTRQGFNPLTTALKWSDLELVKDTGKILPGVGETTTDPVLNGVSVKIPVSAPGRTGRHIVYTIWQASHSDQSYYFCADVNFGGTGGSPSPSPSVSPSRTASPSPSASRSPSAPASPSGPSTPGSCSATYTLTGSWNGGFQAEVRVAAGSTAITGWTVTLAYPSGQTVNQAWNATVTSSGSTATAKNVSYNGALAAGASTTFGLLGTSTGTNTAPVPTCVAS
ncbi:lytic polysaccharide monooxygenase auxiliary activity family 9 protein [Virgisporangium aliadipatigenens]|nr:lytic polysaccharide monooxygenase [Virgisporangium aliadipatigenens]